MTSVTKTGLDEASETEAQALLLRAMQQSYLASIREHSLLVGDLCETLRELGEALDELGLDPGRHASLKAGIRRHVHAARAIVSGLDVSLGAAPARGLH